MGAISSTPSDWGVGGEAHGRGASEHDPFYRLMGAPSRYYLEERGLDAYVTASSLRSAMEVVRRGFGGRIERVGLDAVFGSILTD